VEEPVNVVIMSCATDSFHSNAAMVPGDPNGVKFEACPTMESLRHKESPDENAIY
jgi:hypothetical protein